MANRVVKVNISKIRELAKMKDMNLKQLEAAAGVANGAIGKWVTRDARIDTLFKVAETLETSVDNILEKV